ncbi:MAG TPA: hypothetical protein VD993_11860 [Chitinophagaceae bacterium]|nr:hypothetical protein [Chitinophagaceae bacterium]
MQLQEAYELFKSAPFPANDANSDELSDIYFELADYDGHVAGLVDSLLKKRGDPKNLKYDYELENKLNEFLKKTDPTDPDYATATEMMAYLQKISKLIAVAESGN